MIETDLLLPDGRTLHTYDTGGPGLPTLWHHGTPNTGTPPEPLTHPGIRWISYDRPGYPGSSPDPGRTIASAADYARAVTDALAVDRFAVLGHSGGGAHALATAALLPDRVLAAVSISAMAPFDANGLDWFAGMANDASLRAAAAGRPAKEKHEATAVFDPHVFTPADHAALSGERSWFGGIVNAAMQNGPGGLIDDDLAYVAPWGFSVELITAPVLLLHGESDRMIPVAHAHWLHDQCPTAELRAVPDEGHISVLRHASAALDRLAG